MDGSPSYRALGEPPRERAARPASPRISLATATALIEPLLPRSHLSVADVAAHLGVSRPTLYKLFAEHGGVERYLQARRLELVAAALEDGDDATPIGALADRWGFCEIAHLSRSFRRRYGLSPTAYRRSRRQKPIQLG